MVKHATHKSFVHCFPKLFPLHCQRQHQLRYKNVEDIKNFQIFLFSLPSKNVAYFLFCLQFKDANFEYQKLPFVNTALPSHVPRQITNLNHQGRFFLNVWLECLLYVFNNLYCISIAIWSYRCYLFIMNQSWNAIQNEM